MSRLTGQGQPGRWLIARGQAIGIGTVISLIAVGAILRFAVAAVSPLDLNLHAVGVILILVGVLGLLLRPLAGVRPKPDRRRPSRPFRSKQLEQARAEAAADVARIRDDGTVVSPDTPGNPSRRRSRLRPFRSKQLEQARAEAAADVARIRDDGTGISPDAPAYQEDDL